MNYSTLHQNTKISRARFLLENPVTGERITFLATSEETEGRVHQHRLELPPSSSAARHFHPQQQKCLKVTSGKLRVWVNDLEHVLLPDEDLVILPGQAHAWENDGDSEAVVTVTMRPALRSAEFLRAQVALGKEGKSNKCGLPKAPRYAAFAETFKNEVVFVQHPVQRTLQAVVAAFSKLLTKPAVNTQEKESVMPYLSTPEDLTRLEKVTKEKINHVVETPVVKNKVTVLKPGRDTNGELLAKLEVIPNSKEPKYAETWR